MKKIFSVLGVIGGTLSIIFSFVILGFENGGRPSYEQYGGDAYTGIQNAAVDTANNVMLLTIAVKFASFAILFVLGILAICYFGRLLLNESKYKGVQKKSDANSTNQENELSSHENETNKQDINSNEQDNDLPDI